MNPVQLQPDGRTRLAASAAIGPIVRLALAAALALAATLAAATPAEAQAARSAAAAPAVGNPPTALDTAAILAAARPDIDAANDAWVPGLRHRDAASIVAAYADDGIFIAPDGSVTRGRAAIGRLYEARFPNLPTILDGGVVQHGLALVSATRIYEWGDAWLLTPAPAGGAPVRGTGSYITVWDRGADGHWHIVRNLAL